ncbi:hypothetical protein MPSEU_000340000 [Mayamaea pseudoterrestris]|nr:hypothetical protein MPSEU_000340000 [Mayamaea pseudoterrestris]
MSEHADTSTHLSHRTLHRPMPSQLMDESNHDAEESHLLSQQQHGRPVKLVRRPTKGPIPKPVDYTSLLCGLAAGVCQAGVFNPYDRALYLSVKDSRPFLSKENWKRPYAGFIQSLGGRALAGGLYFPCEHFYLHTLSANESHPLSNFLAGILAGTTTAFIMNPLTTIRYKTWGRDNSSNLFKEARHMLVHSGYSLRPFFNGLNATVCRDAVFGACYTSLRLQLQWIFSLESHNQWQANFCAAGLATMLSSPFNYARTIQYATRSQEIQPSIKQVLVELVEQVRQQPKGLERWVFLQNQLRVGWGTLRVAMGLAFAHSVYDGLQDIFNKNQRINGRL